MSIKVMDKVFRQSEMTGNDRLLMLAIADNADEERQIAWPSISTLSRKTKIPIRTVFRCIKRCVAAGELCYEKGNSERSNRYTILLGLNGGSDKMTPPPVVPNTGTGVVPSCGMGVVPSFGTLTVIEPSVKPSVSVRGKGSLEEVIGFCIEKGIPESDGEWFFYKCQGNGWMNAGKPIKDWQATIMAWSRAGYLPGQKKQTYGSTKSLMDMRTMIEAKKGLAADIRLKFASDAAASTHWSNEEKRLEYFKLKKEIKQLMLTISNSK